MLTMKMYSYLITYLIIGVAIAGMGYSVLSCQELEYMRTIKIKFITAVLIIILIWPYVIWCYYRDIDK